MKDSYLTAGITLNRLLRLLRRNRVPMNPKILARVAFLLQSAIWSSLFASIETIRYGKVLKRCQPPPDPIFIIGHWRTGTTFLHQLMSLDNRLCTPTLFQVAVPDSFLVSYRYYKPLFKRVVSKHRPMDRVNLGMDEPQEDEYAIYRITSFSPLENLVFPKSEGYFLNHGSPFLPQGEELEVWKQTLQRFFTKLHFASGKRIVSKNPFNSFRIPALVEMFPKAKFIHMVRHPYAVIPSTIHMWNIVQRQNALAPGSVPPPVGEVAAMLRRLNETIEADAHGLPAGTLVQLRFEDLEKDPHGSIQSLYQDLGLPFSPELRDRIDSFLSANAGYRKNVFSLTAAEKEIITREMGPQMAAYQPE